MKSFLKSILKKSTSITTINGGGGGGGGGTPITNENFTITNPELTINNSCETIFEGEVRVPIGLTAILKGTLVRGNLGSGSIGNNGASTFLGSRSIPEGTTFYSVDIGNSGLDGKSSIYALELTLSNGLRKTKYIQRTDFDNLYFDRIPC